MSVIYYIHNSFSNKGYIGSTKDFDRRAKEHFDSLRKNCHTNKHLQNAYNLYGESSFNIKILSTCPEEYQYKLEQWFIANSSLNKEYNICLKVLEPPRYIVTEEIREKLRLHGKNIYIKNKCKLEDKVNKLWATQEHREFMHSINSCENHPQTTLTNNIVKEIKEEIFNTPSYKGKRKIICMKYNISIHIYKDIQRKKTWKNV